ncbi:Hypothetical predicted protein [Podarcis lilfordi]|uniref:Uncharacterized protein n=1 Tax=Podarcis lilfordi TaxID=74358 RepID=A0AA35KTQ0_9SAUR|nr:Hypothetical predicted protein [Podarcis lilfordi]
MCLRLKIFFIKLLLRLLSNCCLKLARRISKTPESATGAEGETPEITAEGGAGTGAEEGKVEWMRVRKAQAMAKGKALLSTLPIENVASLGQEGIAKLAKAKLKEDPREGPASLNMMKVLK